jgi:hypothetical protein
MFPTGFAVAFSSAKAVNLGRVCRMHRKRNWLPGVMPWQKRMPLRNNTIFQAGIII